MPDDSDVKFKCEIVVADRSRLVLLFAEFERVIGFVSTVSFEVECIADVDCAFVVVEVVDVVLVVVEYLAVVFCS
jgi:hypothetical protein